MVEALGDEPLTVMSSSSGFFFGATNQHQLQAISSIHLDQARDGQHLYLAQHPLLGKDRAGCQDSKLLQDIPLPPLPSSIKHADTAVTSVNLWLCIGSVRSSLHYDEDSNLLVVIRGSKQVTLYPPSCTTWLAPRAVSDDGSVNHSCIDLSLAEDQIHRSYPFYHLAKRHAVEVGAKEGDGVFIPAGWWHQVDSSDNTIAVNFWWPDSESSFSPSIDVSVNNGSSYYQLRKIFGSCQSQMVEQMIQEICTSSEEAPLAAVNAFETFQRILMAMDSREVLQQDREALSRFIFGLSSSELAHLLLYTSNHHPHLIANIFSQAKLTPLAAYLLTTRLEGLEGLDAKSDPGPLSGPAIDTSVLYQSFYSACGMDPEQAFSFLLAKRKECMEEAARRLVTRVLGL